MRAPRWRSYLSDTRIESQTSLPRAEGTFDRHAALSPRHPEADRILCTREQGEGLLSQSCVTPWPRSSSTPMRTSPRSRIFSAIRTSPQHSATAEYRTRRCSAITTKPSRLVIQRTVQQGLVHGQTEHPAETKPVLVFRTRTEEKTRPSPKESLDRSTRLVSPTGRKPLAFRRRL